MSILPAYRHTPYNITKQTHKLINFAVNCTIKVETKAA